MRADGFPVTVTDTSVIGDIKRMAGIPEPLHACHTAWIRGYVIEGHVPVADVNRLLTERPAAVGLAVPGTPSGPENGKRGPYDVLLLTDDGKHRVYRSYR